MGKIGFDIGGGDASVAEETEVDTNTRTVPNWNVIILNDDDHTYQYVIALLTTLFKMTVEKAFVCAAKIDEEGQCIVETTTKERAELKQEQVHGFGADPYIGHSAGSMTCVIEPAE